MERVLVTGAGGFIGHHLVRYLRHLGFWVRGVDVRPPEFAETAASEFVVKDLRRWEDCLDATKGVDHVYALAADMGGMGYISAHHSRILFNNTLISFQTLEASRVNEVQRYLFASSACVYPEERQLDTAVTPLREEEAYPANPQDAYGWEKLISERLAHHYAADHGMETRVVRYHNVYGPEGKYQGGREKAPAALCRKVAEAADGTEVEVWGDGAQTRSFCYIDDCLEGTYRVMTSDITDPINVGSEELVTIDELAELVILISGKTLGIRHVPGPQGVRGRNSDNSRIRKELGWEPSTPLSLGMPRTYQWIAGQVSRDR